MKNYVRFLLATAGIAALAACGGGGGDSGGGGSSIVISLPVAGDGEIRSEDYVLNTNTGKLTPADGVIVKSSGSLAVTTAGDSVTSTTVTSAGPGSIDFDQAAGDASGVSGGFLAWLATDGDAALMFSYDYMTFGFWDNVTGASPGSTAGVLSVGAFGMQTAASNVPTTGTATYTGGAMGYYVDSTDEPYVIIADAAVGIDFTNDEYAFVTANSADFESGNSMSSLDLVGVGDLSGGDLLTGPVAAVGADLDGDMSGSLYGPNGQEVGGTFGLTGDDGIYFGAFGAAR